MSRATLILVAVLSALAGIVLYRGHDLSWRSVKQRIRGEFPAVKQLSTAELAAWLARDEGPRPILLDVRSEAEYRVSHLPGAVLADRGAGDAALPPGVRKDAPIVAYCAVGFRSSAMAERLRLAGYTHVYNLEGSIFEWANQGHPLYRGDEEVRRVHPYDGQWGRLLDRELHADVSLGDIGP